MSDLSRERLDQLIERVMETIRTPSYSTVEKGVAHMVLEDFRDAILAEPAPEPEPLEWASGEAGTVSAGIWLVWPGRHESEPRLVWYVAPCLPALTGRPIAWRATIDAAKSLAARLDAVLREGEG